MSDEKVEYNIANGIVVKEALFNAVLNNSNLTVAVDFAAKGRSTFIEHVQKMIQPVESHSTIVEEPGERTAEDIINGAGEANEPVQLKEAIENIDAHFKESTEELFKQPTPQPYEIEATLNQGMQFLNGIFKMVTGKELITEEKGITVNRETGEVIIKFKLPGF